MILTLNSLKLVVFFAYNNVQIQILYLYISSDISLVIIIKQGFLLSPKCQKGYMMHGNPVWIHNFRKLYKNLKLCIQRQTKTLLYLEMQASSFCNIKLKNTMIKNFFNNCKDLLKKYMIYTKSMAQLKFTSIRNKISWRQNQYFQYC